MQSEESTIDMGIRQAGFLFAKNNRAKVINRVKYLSRFIGPAFVVSVAYIDPGNFAANISGGSSFNYDLLWVIFWSSIMAIFLQIMSAKLGIATGQNLVEMCKRVFSKRTNNIFFIIAELSSMATTMAEFLGGALGFFLLFGIPLPAAGILTAVITFGIAYLQKFGQRIVEIIITCLVAVICTAYTIELFLAKPDMAAVGYHILVPSITNSDAVLIAVGMLGATVMPHVIYLHSQLVQNRNAAAASIEEKKEHLRMEKIDVAVAMNIAFVVNAAMVVVSAAVFGRQGILVDSIEQAHRTLEPLLGRLSSGAFGIALLASGFSSSVVGAMAGETVIGGFSDIKMSTNLKRFITMLPGMIVIILGVNPMKALILSQVFLSFSLPAAIIPMLVITGRRDLMGCFVNKKWVNTVGWMIALIIVAVNSVLLYMTLMNNM